MNSAPKRLTIGFHVILQIVLAGAMVVIINMAVQRWHPPKLKLTRNDYYELSDKSRQLLSSLKTPIEVIVFFQPDAREPVTARVYDDIQHLLREYVSVSKQVKVRYVDPDRDPVEATKMEKEYGVQVPNVVVFVNPETKRNKFVQVADLVEFAKSGNPFEGSSDRIKAFKGEQQFTSAILSVLDPKLMKVYFLQGHGEGDPTDAESKQGCSGIATYIRRDNLAVDTCNFVKDLQLPKDCDVLVICGPTRPYSDMELQALQNYLQSDGRMLVMLDALREDPGLDRFLAQNGVRVGNDVVLCKIRDRLGGEALIMNAPGVRYGGHAITESFRRELVNTYFPAARSVDAIPADNVGRDRVTVLVESPEGSWGETDLVKLQKNQAMMDDKDRRGPVPMAVAVEPSAAGTMEREGMRMVVFGSSGFIRNSGLSGGNVDLFMNSLNWLLKRQQLIGIAPKTPQEFTLALNAYQMRALFLTEVVAIPLAVAAIGFLVWLQRRK